MLQVAACLRWSQGLGVCGLKSTTKNLDLFQVRVHKVVGLLRIQVRAFAQVGQGGCLRDFGGTFAILAHPPHHIIHHPGLHRGQRQRRRGSRRSRYRSKLIQRAESRVSSLEQFEPGWSRRRKSRTQPWQRKRVAMLSVSRGDSKIEFRPCICRCWRDGPGHHRLGPAPTRFHLPPPAPPVEAPAPAPSPG